MNQPNYPQGGYPQQPQQGQPYQQQPQQPQAPQPQAPQQSQPYQQPQPYGGQQAYGGQQSQQGQQQGQQKVRDPNDDFEFDGDVKGAENVEQVDYAFWTDIKPSWGKLTDDPQLVVGTWPAIVISSKAHDDVHYVSGKNLGKKIKMFVGLDCGPNGPRKTVLEINPNEQSFLFKRLLENVAPDLVGVKFKAWKMKGRRFWASIRFGSAGSKWAEDGENPQLRIRSMQPWNNGQPPTQAPAPNGQSQLFPQQQQQPAPQQVPYNQQPGGSFPQQQGQAPQQGQQQPVPQQGQGFYQPPQQQPAPQGQPYQGQPYQGGYGGQGHGTQYGGAPQQNQVAGQTYGTPQAPGTPGQPVQPSGYPADEDLPF